MKNTYIKISTLLVLVLVTVANLQVSYAKPISLNIACALPKDSIPLARLDVDEFKDLVASGAIVLDTRSTGEFAAGHVPNSIYVGWNGPFKAWVSKVFPNKDQSLVLISDQAGLAQVTATLLELGYSHVLGYLAEGVEAYKLENRLDSIVEVSVKAYYDLSTSGQIIDVRSEKEFINEHIDNAMNFPLKDFYNFNVDIPHDKNYYVQCLSGYRSMIAISILKAKGVENVINVQGGYQALKKIKEDK